MTALVGSYVEDFKGMAIKATQYQDATGAVLTVTSNAGATTDNAVSRFDGVAGALQNSVLVVTDAGATSGVTSLAMGGALSGVTTLACGAITTTGAFTQTGAVNTVFNSSNLTSDFTVKALTSGNGLAYASAADTLTLGKSTTATTNAGTLVVTGAATFSSTVTKDGTSIVATGLEINQACQASTRMVAGGSTLTLTGALHNGKTIALDTASGTTITLPAASGTGNIFRFLVTVLATSNSHIIKVANGSDAMSGIIATMSDDPATVKGFAAVSGTSDTITLNRTTTGSVTIGEWIEIMDVASNKFFVKGVTSSTGTEATPFSATV